jgi:hypothetical protein
MHQDIKQMIIKALHSNDDGVTVSFTKKDGTDRDMLCTLIESKIPEDMKPKTEGTKASDSTLRVFDLEKQGWRSFQWDTIKTVKGI